MSGKNGKKGGGDPRKRTSGRVTPPKPKSKTRGTQPSAQNIPLEPTTIKIAEVIEFIVSPLEKIPEPEEPFYIEGFEAFNPLFDDDDYFIKLREAFAREMKMVQGEFYPDPALAQSAHLLFVERLVEQLRERVPVIARETQDTLENYFRERFERHGEPGSFERWDTEVMNNFFSERRLERLAEIGIPIEYHDEIVDGPVTVQAGKSFSTVSHNFIVEGEQVAFVPQSIQLFSVLVNKALREGYNFDEIVDGLARHALSFEIMNFACASQVTNIEDDLVEIQIGLTKASLNADLEFVGQPIGKWGHCGFLSSLHCRLGDDIGIGYYAERSIIELLDQYDPAFYERLFAATISNGDEGRKHEIVTDTLQQFVEDVFDNPRIVGILSQMIEGSKPGMEGSAPLHHALFSALILDKHWGSVAQAITSDTDARRLDYTFFTTPAVVENAFKGLSR